MIELNVRTINFAVQTRAQRRASLDVIIRQLARIREAEIEKIYNMPTSLSFTKNSRIGKNAIEAIESAMHSLVEAYCSAEDNEYTQMSMSDYIPF
jgi:ribosomal protein S8E